MAGRPSAIGFGFQPFGLFPFGSADWAEEVTWKITPTMYRDDDAKCEFSPSEPLRKTIDALKPQFQEILDRYEQFPDLWDANAVPIAQLRSLGFNFNIGLEALKNVTGDVLATIGDVDATLDFTTVTVAPPAPIEPGTVTIQVTRADDTPVTFRDDGNGNFPSGLTLPSGGTIDYPSGGLTGITAELLAGSTVTIDYIYSIKDTRLQRSEVLNAIKFFVNKGLDRGYEIAAALSGLLVTVTPRWATSTASTATQQDDGPTTFFAKFDAFPADIIPTDATFDDFFDEWPRRLTWDNPVRSNFLKLFFFATDDKEIENFSAVVEDVLINIERVRPIHVQLESVTFDGPRVSGGGWTIPVVSEGSASGGGWTISVEGEKRVSGGGWTIPVVATPAS